MRGLIYGVALWIAGVNFGAADVTGNARVIDGDTIVIGELRIRLAGMDAPENDQTCQTEHGVNWRCGQWVTQELRAMLRGQTVYCEDLGDGGYGRMLGACEVDGRDLSATLVARGYAWVDPRFSQDLVGAEKAAAIEGLGLWAMSSLRPWDHRNQDRQTPSAPNPDCVIKGNISDNGRIYHLPHHQHYDATVINEDRGERWFCTTQAAERAGWRVARQ